VFNRKQQLMQYLGKISGHGVLQRMGRALADATYEIEAFQHNKGLVKASGEISLDRNMSKGLAGVSRMQLRIDTGELLEIKRPDAERPVSRQFDFEVVSDLTRVGNWKRSY
jgi:hypothetical protein